MSSLRKNENSNETKRHISFGMDGLVEPSPRYYQYIDLKNVQDLINGVFDSLGLASVVINHQGQMIVQAGYRPLCALFHRSHPECAKMCIDSVNNLSAKAASQKNTTHFQFCFHGLVEIVVPIVVNNDHIANLFSGQFFFEEPDISYYTKKAAQYGFDETSYLESVKEVPIISEEKAKQIIAFLNTLTQVYSDLTYQKMELAELNIALSKSETSLRESETKYRVLFDSFPLGITISDSSGAIIENNSKALEIVDLHKKSEAETKIEANEWKIIRPDGSIMPTYECAGVQALKENKLVEHSIMGIVKPNKEPIWLNMTSSPLDLEGFGVVSTFIDITKHRETEHKYQLLFKEMLNAFAHHEIILDDDGKMVDYRYLDVNPAFETMTGLKAQDVIGKRVLEVIPNLESYWIESFGSVALTGNPIMIEDYVEALDKYFEVTAFQPSPHTFSCIFTEVTERKKAQLALERRAKYEKLLSSISLSASVTKDLDSFKSEVVELLGQSLELSRVQVFEKDLDGEMKVKHLWCAMGITNPRDQKEQVPVEDLPIWWNNAMQSNEIVAYSDIKDIPNSVVRDVLESQMVKSMLSIPLFISETYYGFISFDDCITHREWPTEDVHILESISRIISTTTEQFLLEEHLQHQRCHDFLTGLKNRRCLEANLERLSDESYLPVSLIIADTNGLKLINDSFGHEMGDQVLIQAAQILQKNSTPHDIVSRYGGDEFVMILPNTTKEETVLRLKKIASMVKEVEVASIQLTLSFGYHTRVATTDEFSSVFKTAEDMMYRNKLHESTSNKYKTIGLAMNSLFAKSARESQHSKRVSRLCEFIAHSWGFSKREVNRMRIAGLMHDIGKIGVSEDILNNPHKLNQSQWLDMQRHPEIGYRILSTSSDFVDISKAILEHHEKWDGSGYPRGISGEEISIQARIIAVADSFDAMTRERPYQRIKSEKEAIEEIIACSGTHFDPSIAKVFVENYHNFDYNE